MENKITAILSDYDGTLSPMNLVKNKDATIPMELEDVLWEVSKRIPVCIISSKDYHFLRPRTKFAKILSCILGIETLTLTIRNEGLMKCENIKSTSLNAGCNTSLCGIEDKHLMLYDSKTLQTNSDLLVGLADSVSLKYKDIMVERKFTSDKRILAGITFDYRHTENWSSYKNNLEPFLKQMIQDSRSCSPSTGSEQLNLQTYALHPFLDVYITKCDKGMAFDYVTYKISTLAGKRNRKGPQKVMYLGDSENDNPAFIKANISVGIRSDERLNPKLFCRTVVKFDQLSIFLKRLMDNDFVFSDGILPTN
jgi:hydroxymethylpyrimidine pyrophosphatase-like HAD family hydrolase